MPSADCPTIGENEFIDSEFRYTLFPIFYGIFFVLGLLANCYALYVLHRMRESKAMNEIRIYMTNLTVADLLFVAALPFWIDYYMNHGHWRFSDALCSITGSFFYINQYCSFLFLALISINRYWAVTRPLVAASSDCWKRGAIISVIIWVFTLSVAIPQLTKEGIQKNNITNRSLCFEGYHNTDDSMKNLLVIYHFFIIGLFCVVFLMAVICNILIARALLSQSISKPRASTGKRPIGTKRRALRMLCAVVGIFVICFLPHHVVQGPWGLMMVGKADGQCCSYTTCRGCAWIHVFVHPSSCLRLSSSMCVYMGHQGYASSLTVLSQMAPKRKV
ncbi:hypothetical protein DNTS_016342 [Danionella cerebrum]|uniref:Platelet-activating factor receptor n=1 Tax=Danionella cerebrum TaxID=2873325 RepID=A0A553QYR8_9TELE|nr:hypothetical protein DNTS_016342 [Danionella translucida]